MSIKDKMKQYNFWISLVSACLLVARLVASKFNYEIDSSLVMDITTGLCGIFVIMGIISAPTKIVTKIVDSVSSDESVKEDLTKMIETKEETGSIDQDTNAEEIENAISEKLQNYLENTKNPSDFSSNSAVFAENESTQSQPQPEACDENIVQDFGEACSEVCDEIVNETKLVKPNNSSFKTINGVIYDLNQLSKDELLSILTNN